jgi:hypothetical protein
LPRTQPDTTAKSIQVGLLTWLVPGLGHFVQGHRGLAVVFFLAISLPYFTGLAIGGVTNSVNPRTNRWLFLAELGIGGYTVPAYFASQAIEQQILDDLGFAESPDPTRSAQQRDAYQTWVEARAPYVAYYPESDIAVIYLATAGLLNILAILDAIARVQTGGLPTFYRELLATEGEPSS